MIYLLNKNNMKKLAYIATIACSMFLTTSCVDLTQEPQSFITDEDYIASMDLTGLQQAATGLYNDLWNGNYGFNCRLQRINVCADDITYRAAKANNELANYYRLSPNITANTADFDTTWSLFFAVINHSNTLINKTVLPENADQAKKFEEVLGEAYFLRGLSYFYLVRMYGDVPLILAETDASTYMPRTAVAEIYDQAIIPSLKKAVEILPAKSRSGFSSTPSKWAAEACLADAYMTMAGWPLKRGQEYYSLAAAAPKLKKGETAQVNEITTREDKTKPPLYFTEGTLIAAMENIWRAFEDENLQKQLKDAGGIGTPATRAAIISELKRRGFLETEGKKLHCSTVGRNLLLKVSPKIRSAVMTARFEEMLKEVEAGKAGVNDFVAQYEAFILTELNEAKRQAWGDPF